MTPQQVIRFGGAARGAVSPDGGHRWGGANNAHTRHVIAAVAVALAAACAHDRPDSADIERELLNQRQSAFLTALAARDADSTAALFSDDAVLHVANMPAIEGRSAIRQFYGRMFGFLSASSATPEATHVSEAGDMAYGIGRVSNEFRGPQGPTQYTGKYLLVWRKLAGEWMIVLYSVSSNQPDAIR